MQAVSGAAGVWRDHQVIFVPRRSHFWSAGCRLRFSSLLLQWILSNSLHQRKNGVGAVPLEYAAFPSNLPCWERRRTKITRWSRRTPAAPETACIHDWSLFAIWRLDRVGGWQEWNLLVGRILHSKKDLSEVEWARCEFLSCPYSKE